MIRGRRPEKLDRLPQQSVVKNYRDLEVWERGNAVALKGYRPTSQFPRNRQFAVVFSTVACSASRRSDVFSFAQGFPATPGPRQVAQRLLRLQPGPGTGTGKTSSGVSH